MSVPCGTARTRWWSSRRGATTSRFVRAWHRVDIATLADRLLEQRHLWPGAVLLPSSDAAVEALLSRIGELSRHYRVASPGDEVYWTFQNKMKAFEAIRKLGIPQPHCFLPDCIEELDDKARQLDFPVLLKPVSSHRFFSRFRCKMWLVETPEELRKRWIQAHEAGVECSVCEYIPGPDNGLYFHVSHRHQGIIRGEVLVQKLRQYPPRFGVGRVVRTVALNESIRETVGRILSSCDYEGFSSAEFKFDPRDGKYKFIELNLRLVLQDSLFTAAGINFTRQLVAAAAGEPVPLEHGYREGLYWHYAAADLVNTLRDPGSLETSSLRELIAPYRQAGSVPLIPFKEDPRLFLRKFSGAVSKVMRRALNGS